ncbi:MAG: DUF2513 domain-containing protein [Alphaproteobacteria bacterium]|nr:DUF2513 domain-containing protein [Alphaproteobacteria bacterium]
MDLILRILRCIRSRNDDENAGFTGAPDFVPEVPEGRVQYHIDLCVHKGLLEKRREKNPHTRPTWRLTWQGHDWLEERSDC